MHEQLTKYLDGKELGWTAYIVMFFYYLLLEGLMGTTPGKLITRTKITDYNGNRITFKQAFWRSLVRLVPWDFLTFLSKDRDGWHDDFSDTKVVNKQ